MNRAETATDNVKQVVKVLEEFLYGPAEEDPRSLTTPRATPRGSSEAESDAVTSPRSSEKRKRSSVMGILKGMKERRSSVSQLKKSEKKTSKSNVREKSPRNSSSILKFDESPTIKYYHQDEVVPVSLPRANTFSHAISPYKDIDFNDLAALERAPLSLSPRRELGHSTPLSPRKETKKTGPDTSTESSVNAQTSMTLQTGEHQSDAKSTVGEASAATETKSNHNEARDVSPDVATQKTTQKWQSVRTSSQGSRSSFGSESMVGSYRFNPYFTYRSSMREKLEEIEARDRSGGNSIAMGELNGQKKSTQINLDQSAGTAKNSSTNEDNNIQMSPRVNNNNNNTNIVEDNTVASRNGSKLTTNSAPIIRAGTEDEVKSSKDKKEKKKTSRSKNTKKDKVDLKN